MKSAEREVERAVVQADMRAFDTHAPVAKVDLGIDPLKMQLIAHFDALTTDYAKRVAIRQIACLANLCATCKMEKQ